MSSTVSSAATALTESFLGCADPQKAAHLMRFFKTGRGQYGEGDRFLGITVPVTRSLIKPFRGKTTLSDCGHLLDSEWHEIRLAALLLMADLAKRTLRKNDADTLRKIVSFYDDRLDRVNNWDLVDMSVRDIVGAYWQGTGIGADERRLFLARWADSGNLWRERAAMIATYAAQRMGSLDETFRLAEHFIDHPHDLMHKACGWMLREAGKRNRDAQRAFLAANHTRLPRTTLRYAIEHMDRGERLAWMAR